LNNEELQNQIYNELMLLGYRALVAAGTIVEPNTTATTTTTAISYVNNSAYAQTANAINTQVMSNTGGLVNAAATYGPEATTSWASGGAPVDPSIIDVLVKSSQSAINFAINILSGLVSGVRSALGYANTVNRDTVDAATTRVIGNAKIETPTYAPPPPGGVGDDFDITQAQKYVTDAVKQLG
jgi:hypothetical protein